MLTTSNYKYLQPDYLQPLPTTLDAKKSPLALLAQTCSSIGKDIPSKPIIPPLEKKTESRTSPRKSPHSEESARPTSTEASKTPILETKPKRDRAVPKDIPPLVPISKSTSKSPSLPSRSSPNETRSSPSNTSRSSNQTTTTQDNVRGSSDQDSVSRSSVSTTQVTGTVATARPFDPPSNVSAGSFVHPGYYPHLFGHLPLDPAALATNPAYAGLSAHTLASLHSAASLKSGAPTSPGTAAALNPYVSYARVKTASGGTNLVPICRDPYCTTCQMSVHTAQMAPNTCTAACTECNHQKSLYPGLPTSAASGIERHLQSQLLTGLLPGYIPGLGLPSLYPHLAAPTTPASHQASVPHVCNWVSGTEYCGKRFSSPEELLQHLRTHTSTSDVAPPSIPGLPAFNLQPTSIPQSPYVPSSSLSPNSLRRAYPSSLSPISSSRYHPYAKPGSVPGIPSASVPSLPLQTLGAYYSPYAALYGSRLGPTVAP